MSSNEWFARRTAGAPRLGVLGVVVSLALACTAAPPNATGPGSSPSAAASTGESLPPGASPTPAATSPLYGQPPPVDPCSLLTDGEVRTVLSESTTRAPQETSGGAAASCIYTTDKPLSRVAVTVIKTVQTPLGFARRRETFGNAVRTIPAMGDGAYVIIFGGTVTVTVLKDGVELYIDVSKDGRIGEQILEPALALMERAVTRFPTASPAP